jgi:hypothetical protein
MRAHTFPSASDYCAAEGCYAHPGSLARMALPCPADLTDAKAADPTSRRDYERHTDAVARLDALELAINDIRHALVGDPEMLRAEVVRALAGLDRRLGGGR